MSAYHSPKPQKNRLKLWQGEHFNALAALLNAGMSPAHAVTLLGKQYTYLQSALTRMSRDLNKGRSLKQAFRASGLLGSIDLEILSTAEQAGKTVEALKFIGRRFDVRASRLKKVKSQLVLPTLIFILAVIIGFVIQVVSQAASMDTASVQAALYILGFTIIMKMVFAGITKDSTSWMVLLSRTGMASWFSLAQRSFEYTWLTLLLWQHTAGIDWVTATERIATLTPVTRFKQKIRASNIALQQGESLTAAFAVSGVPLSQAAILTLQTGESSGNMAQSLEHYLTIEAEQLNDSIQLLTDWLPRLAYVFIVIFVISHVIPTPSV